MMRVSAWAVFLTLLMPLDASSSACRRAWGVRKGEPTPCAGVILPINAAKRCARLAVKLDQRGLELLECQRRLAAPLPQVCTPTTLTKIKHIPQPRPTWHIVAAAVVGFAAGALTVWRLTP